MRHAQPNFFVPFDRAGIDPFDQPFPVTLRLEGTVRGTGGLRIVDDGCATSVPGLYAAGDAASRELICGGFTGGGSHNAAWAMSSGFWAGASAGDYGRQRKSRSQVARRTGGVALISGHAPAVNAESLVAAVRAEVVPFERNYFRTGAVLGESLSRLNALWRGIRTAAASSRDDVVKAREAAAMLATARWMYTSALARTETRGMHKRYDHLQQDERQRAYLSVGGLDETWVSPRPAPRLLQQGLAA